MKKSVTLKTGKTVEVRTQSADFKFVLWAFEGQEFGDYKAGDAEDALTCSESQCVDTRTGELIPNLYWATVK